MDMENRSDEPALAAGMEIVAEGLGFPEGPVWLADGSVVVVEIKTGRITRLWPDGRRRVVATPGGGPNGAALGPDGKLYVCNNGGFEWPDHGGLMVPAGVAADYEVGRIERIDLDTGAVERLYDHVDGRPLSGPNDIVFDAQGGFWFTDLGKVRATGTDHGGIYYARADGSLIRAALYPLGGPNGIGLSPDGRTLYVAQTHERNLLAFDVVAPGELAPPGLVPGRVVASFPGHTLLDSLAVTASGNICVGTLVERPGIASVDPATGAITWHPFPDLLTTNICFGGTDMRDAWVCLSTTGKLARVRWPEPGLRLAPQR